MQPGQGDKARLRDRDALLQLLSSGPVCSEGPRNGWWEHSELLLHIAADTRLVAGRPDIRRADRL